MNLKKMLWSAVLVIICIFALVLIFVIGNKNEEKIDNNSSNKKQVVVSNFASYDFARAIIKGSDKIDLTFIMGPGKDSHSYDPTVQDILKIEKADLFIYVGGEMEKWIDKVLESKDSTKNAVCVADFVETIEEKEVDGAEEEEEEEEEEGAFDEHIWTSPENAKKMVRGIEERLEKLLPDESEIFRKNAEEYIEKIDEVDGKIREIVDNKVRNRLIFADKMPMQYFIDYYNLEVSAAFSGCSTEVEPSSATIAYLEKLIKEQNIPVVLYIELNSGKVAKTIAEETDAKAMQIQTLHNLSKDDFDRGETWVSLMTRNLDVLKEALD